MAVQGVILDVDGTLVLSNQAHAQAWVDAFAAYGYEIAFEQVRPLIGMGGDRIIPKLKPGLTKDKGDGKDISQVRQELIINRYGPKLQLANGSRQLVLHMQEKGLKLVIASSFTSEELQVLLKAAQVDDLINQMTTSRDAEASKPAAEPIVAALHKLQLQPDRVLLLGDTPYDIQSAKAAGVGAIAVRCGGFDDIQLAGAIAIYDDPADLLANYANSPLSQWHRNMLVERGMHFFLQY